MCDVCNGTPLGQRLRANKFWLILQNVIEMIRRINELILQNVMEMIRGSMKGLLESSGKNFYHVTLNV
jgi:hypothetical protein